MGEPVVLRNAGRSNSQISVFDYPEHLNPFYEDENHKRLRFWKIGKKDGSSSSRRGSFSLSGIRDMWSFKSFRGKKKSSSLGINKTSESPEPLRRSIGPNDTLYATYDPRIRNTYDNGTLNNNFQRNIPYRASLQDMAYNKTIEQNGNGFQRNDNYRSTIQIAGRRDDFSAGHTTPRVPPRRYVYGGSITPQPRSRFDRNDSCSQGISRGSSQLSVASSTNPFEEYDDDDDDDIIMGHLEISESGKPTPTKRRLRKKRRAPPPPIPIPKIINEETNSIPTSPVTTPSKTSQQQQQQLEQPIPNESDHEDDYSHENRLATQNQFKKEFTQQEQLEISEIAAEIEHFVKLLTQDEDEDSAIQLIPISPKQPTTKIQIQPATPEFKVSEQSPIFKGEIIPAYVTVSSEITKRQTTPVNMPQSTEEVQSVEEKKELVVKAEISAESYRHDQDEVLEDLPHVQVYRSGSFGKIEDIKVSTEELNGNIEVHRKNSPEKPKPASRQHIRVVNKLIIHDDANKIETNVFDTKPEPSNRQYSQIENEIRNIDHSTPKKDTISNGFLPNRSNHQQDDERNNNYDDRSASSKEQTPLNSSYDTSDDRVRDSVELKIIESKEDISEISNASSTDRFRIRYVPLKAGSDSPPEMRREIKLSNHQREVLGNYNNTTNGGTGNRRSVKEIIASINRSQSLLKFNKDPPKNSPINSTNSSSLKDLSVEPVPPPRRKTELATKEQIDLIESFRRLSQSEQEAKRMIVEMENLRDEQADNYREQDASFLQRFDEEVNNNDIFRKCVLKKSLFREGSPTASNLDWNPLPKPKRTKNLSAELNSSTSSNGK